MKTIACTFIFGIVILASVHASEAQLVRGIGIKAGAVAANQDWDLSLVKVDNRTRWGYDAGVFVEWLNVPFISVLTELHYVQKGSNASTNIPVTSVGDPDGSGQYLTFVSRVDYLLTPVMFKLRIDVGTLSPYVLAGPSFDFFLGDHTQGIGNMLEDSRKTEVNGLIGVGIEFSSLGPFQVGTELRYHPSFQDSYSVRFLKVRNRSLEILLTLRC